MSISRIKFAGIRRKALLLSLSLLIFLVCSEIAFGIVFWIRDQTGGAIHLERTLDHPYTYFTFAPDPGSSTNEDGLYTRASKAKPPGKFRIILVGGSVARSGQFRLSFDQTIAWLLEKELNARLGTSDIEVVNAGFSAYVAEQEFILIQLVLQSYQPDMIISLDGFNDLLSFDTNRPDEPIYAPTQYRQLKPVAQGKAERSAVHRIKVTLRNTIRAGNYFMSALRKDKNLDHSSITPDQIDRAAAVYLGIIRDMKDFTSAKNIAFFSFLQPVKWYDPNSPTHVRAGGVPQLANLYARYDATFRQTSWARSLTDVLDTRMDLYVDDVHVVAEGNRLLSSAMADSLEKRLSKDAASGKISPLQFP